MLDDGLVLAPRNQGDRFERLEVRVDTIGLRLGDDTDLTIGVDPAIEVPNDRDEELFPRAADVFFAINAESPLLSDPEIRRALVGGLDRQKIIDEYFVGALPMTSIVAPSVPGGSDDACADACSTPDPELVPGDTEVFIDFFVVEGADSFEQRLAEEIASQLRAIGVNAAARAHPIEDYGRRVADGELDVFRFGSVAAAIVADSELASSFASSGRDNVSGVSVAEIDALVAEARTTADDDARAELYADVEALVWENMLIVPIAQLQHRLVFGPDVESARIAADGSIVLESVEFAG